MKITPVAQGMGPAVSSNEGRSAGPDRIERAKAVLNGGTASIAPEELPPDPREQQNVRKIKMKTNATPLENMANVPAENEQVDVSDANKTVPVANEETKPLSPQFAALAKQKRALQLKEQEIKAREETLKGQGQDIQGLQSLKARLKSDPLGVLQEEGITYDTLTEAILSNQSGNNPQIQKLQAEIQALKEGLENQNKSLNDRDVQSEKQVLSQIGREIDQLSSDGDDYEMIRTTGSRQDVLDLIKRTFDERGYVMDTDKAMQLVENDLIEQYDKLSQANKLKARQASLASQQTAPVQTDRGNVRQMRTLTARDGVTELPSRKERAMAAFYGRR